MHGGKSTPTPRLRGRKIDWSCGTTRSARRRSLTRMPPRFAPSSKTCSWVPRKPAAPCRFADTRAQPGKRQRTRRSRMSGRRMSPSICAGSASRNSRSHPRVHRSLRIRPHPARLWRGTEGSRSPATRRRSNRRRVNLSIHSRRHPSRGSRRRLRPVSAVTSRQGSTFRWD
jgi:hypothetical protein